MFYCKNLGIWYILLTLLETTKQYLLLEESNLQSLGKPYETGDSYKKNETQHLPDFSHNNDDYPDIQEYYPFQREGRDVQEYYDYGDEKDSPNLSKGLGLFSWWRSRPEAKTLKSGTYPPLPEVTNPVTEHVTNVTDTTSSTNETDAVLSTVAGVASSIPDTGLRSVTDTGSSIIPDTASSGVTDTASSGVTDTASSNVTDAESSIVSDKVPSNVTDTVPNNVTDTVPNNVTDTLPSTVADTVSTTVADTMSTTDTDTAESTDLTTCYVITRECIPLIKGTAATCLGLSEDTIDLFCATYNRSDAPEVNSFSNDNTTADQSTTPLNTVAMGSSATSLDTTSSAISVAAAGQHTTASPAMNGTTTGQNATATLAVSAANTAQNTTTLVMNGTTTAQNTATPGMSTALNTAPGQNTLALAMNGTIAGQNTAAAQAVSSTTGTALAESNTTPVQDSKLTNPAGTGSNTDTTISKTTVGPSATDAASTGISIPGALNMYGAGVFLPIYEIPLTPLIVTNTRSPTPTKKKKISFIQHGLNYETVTRLSKLRLSNSSSYNNNQNHLSPTSNEKNNVMYDYRCAPVLGTTPVKYLFVADQAKKIDHITTANIIYSADNLVHTSGVKVNRNQPLLLNKLSTQNPKNEVRIFKPNHNLISKLENNQNYHPIMLNEKFASLNNTRYEPIQNPSANQILPAPYTTSQIPFIGSQKVYNSNLQSYLPTQITKTVPMVLSANPPALNSNIQTAEINAVLNKKYLPNEFVKYNDTYLLRNSNTSIDLVNFCKHVTCQGKNYLPECCSKAYGPIKCQGEDFSYLKPIPADKTTPRKYVDSFVPLINATISQFAALYTNNISNFPSSPKPNSVRVIRENDMNDFVKFQLMHGMSAPDGKEMMKALKEASLEVQKVNREFHPIDQGNALQMNENIHLPIIDSHILSKKEPNIALLPFNSNKILDDLRATISNSMLQTNLKPSPFQKDRYRFIRNQSLKDQMESIRDNNMVLQKIKKETEMELQRLCLLENKRREEEVLFDKKREDDLKELRTIQDLIHREFESRIQGDSAKYDKLVTNESTNSKSLNNIANSAKNGDMDSLILDKFSSLASNASNSLKPALDPVDVGKCPELGINSFASIPHDDALLFLNIGSDNDSLSEKQRMRREGSNNAKNKLLKENIKSVHSTENNTDILR